MSYYLLCRNLNKYEMIDRSVNPYEVIAHYPNDDWYLSVYFFNEEHKKKYDATLADFEQHPEKYRGADGKLRPPSGIAGLVGATTDRLVFDFDNGDNIELARKDAVTAVDRLRTMGIEPGSMQICYSGGKGFSVLVKTDTTFNSKELKTICTKIAGDLATFDSKVYNDVRVLRLPLTRHQKTGHYKIPLSPTELSSLTMPEIQKRAVDTAWVSSLSLDELYMEEASLPEQLLVESASEPVVEHDTGMELEDIESLDWSMKPRWLTNCKFALYKGFFKEGSRDHFFTVLASTFKSQFPDDKGMVYRMLKSVAENQSRRNGADRFPDKDIFVKVEQVFKPTWNGGQYSCKNDAELKKLCDSLGHHKCQHEAATTEVYDVESVSKMFREYATKIDDNTIKTGIGPIDDNVRIAAGMHVGILAAPGAGKTSMILNVLNNTSQAGVKSFFFSMDMYAPLIYQKQLQKLTGYGEKRILELMESGAEELAIAEQQLATEYENVRFCFKSGLTVEDIRSIVLQHQQDTGERIKLIAIDYAECIAGPYSDPFANSRIIAHKLKDLASQDGFCVITLVQPPKTAGDASTPLYSMRQVKGPSDWEQGFGIIMGLYREGYNPNTSADDRFITINSLKNRMGPMFKVDCAWNGLRGTISPLDEEGEMELAALRERKAQNAPASSSAAVYPFAKKEWK